MSKLSFCSRLWTRLDFLCVCIVGHKGVGLGGPRKYVWTHLNCSPSVSLVCFHVFVVYDGSFIFCLSVSLFFFCFSVFVCLVLCLALSFETSETATPPDRLTNIHAMTADRSIWFLFWFFKLPDALSLIPLQPLNNARLLLSKTEGSFH